MAELTDDLLAPAMVGSKVGAMLLLAAIGVIGAVIPVYLRRLKMGTVMSLCNAFAGGAFLALGVFHILPDAVGELEEAGITISIGKESFNVTYILVFSGYVLILFSESVLFDPAKSPNYTDCHHGHSHAAAPLPPCSVSLMLATKATSPCSLEDSVSEQPFPSSFSPKGNPSPSPVYPGPHYDNSSLVVNHTCDDRDLSVLCLSCQAHICTCLNDGADSAAESVKLQRIVSRQIGNAEHDGCFEKDDAPPLCCYSPQREPTSQASCKTASASSDDLEGGSKGGGENAGVRSGEKYASRQSTRQGSMPNVTILSSDDLIIETAPRDSWKYMFQTGSVFLMVALALHGLFEGIVVGTTSDVTGVWMMTAVIFGHKWAESFALMTQFLEIDLGQRSVYILITTFILSSPVGIAVGLGAASQGKTTAGVFSALGAGTVFYVASEITAEVFAFGGRWRGLKFLVYLVGAGAVLGLTLLEKAV